MDVRVLLITEVRRFVAYIRAADGRAGGRLTGSIRRASRARDAASTHDGSDAASAVLLARCFMAQLQGAHHSPAGRGTGGPPLPVDSYLAAAAAEAEWPQWWWWWWQRNCELSRQHRRRLLEMTVGARFPLPFLPLLFPCLSSLLSSLPGLSSSHFPSSPVPSLYCPTPPVLCPSFFPFVPTLTP